MKKHKVTLIETANLNDIREGDIYVKMDVNTGLIKEMAKRTNGKMVSMLYSSKEETKIEEIKEVKKIEEPVKTRKKTVKEVPASEDTLNVKPLKIE